MRKIETIGTVVDVGDDFGNPLAFGPSPVVTIANSDEHAGPSRINITDEQARVLGALVYCKVRITIEEVE